MATTVACKPWGKGSTDIIGPITRSSEDYTNPRVFYDNFTKWIEVIPLRQPTSIMKLLKEKVILRFGCPKELLSDNGSQYTSEEFAETLKEYRIKHLRILPSAPQCHPTERENRVLKQAHEVFRGLMK